MEEEEEMKSSSQKATVGRGRQESYTGRNLNLDRNDAQSQNDKRRGTKSHVNRIQEQKSQRKL